MSLGSTRAARVRRSGGTRRSRPAVARLAVCLVLLLFTACQSPKAPPPAEWIGYRIGAPDRLAITILPEPIIVEEVVVRPDGMITVQLIGDVPAGARTTQEVAAEIQERIARYKRGAVVTVSLVEAASALVTVVGEVNRPQTIALTRQMRVSEALGTAGDMTYLANSDEVRVVRPGLNGRPEVILIDMDAILDGDLTTNVQLYGGDLVYVPPTLLARFGYVMRQILFPFDPLLGVARAAGGAALVR